ncbi:hypothetical protein GBW32_04090 [Streptomyces tsukubensis]|nr:hypothetical protein GBW32_04090 [Streptomyces tsukubensis]
MIAATGLAALGLLAATPAAAQAPGAAPQYTEAQVRAFLVGFYGDHGPSEKDRIYKVTEELKKKASETEEYDLLLCAQNTPDTVRIGKVTTEASAATGWAQVTPVFSGGTQSHLTAYVGLDASKPMKLSDITCDL